jgi:thiamine-monophosphate kinase
VATAPRLSEFGRIARFFAPLAAPGALGLVDDVALIDGPDDEQYVLTTDAIVEGVDYFAADPPGQVAQKLLRVNLSDLAAKGARPFGYLLTTVLPKTCDEAWLAAFTAGLAADQAAYGIGLLGGDSSSTPGPATLSVTAIGRVVQGRAVLRAGAKAGDAIFVSGTIGDAALGLAALKGELAALDQTARNFLIDRYHLPQPRLRLGQALVGLVHAMIDVSDGLVADLGHICSASGLGARIGAHRIPRSAAAGTVLDGAPNQIAAILGGGDDYELLFTLAAEMSHDIDAAMREAGVPVTRIGEMEKGEGVRVLDEGGNAMPLESAGYTHF